MPRSFKRQLVSLTCSGAWGPLCESMDDDAELMALLAVLLNDAELDAIVASMLHDPELERMVDAILAESDMMIEPG
jgi:hypothetical protein